MIETAEEFVLLRRSHDQRNYLRAATEAADKVVWLDITERFPGMRFWVAQNKTVPLEVLDVLARDSDPAVRLMVAMKNKLTYDLFPLVASDSDGGVRQGGQFGAIRWAAS